MEGALCERNSPQSAEKQATDSSGQLSSRSLTTAAAVTSTKAPIFHTLYMSNFTRIFLCDPL